MSFQDDTLDALNKTKAQLTLFIIGNTAQPNTPAFAQLEAAIDERAVVQARIQSIISAQFNLGANGLGDAVAKLQAATDQLSGVKKSMDQLNAGLQLAGTIVGIATTILGIAVAV